MTEGRDSVAKSDLIFMGALIKHLMKGEEGVKKDTKSFVVRHGWTLGVLMHRTAWDRP